MRRERRFDLLAALSSKDALVALTLYLAVTGLYFWPLLSRMATHIPGDMFIFTHYGNTIFYHFDFARGFQIPNHTDFQKYPDGGYLVLNSWINIVFIAVMRNLISLPAAFNLSILLSFLLAPMAAYLLARELFASRPGAFLAGLVYGFHPLVQNAVALGTIEQLHHGWLALYLLFLVRILRGGRLWANAAGLAVSLFACYMTFPSFAIFALLFTVLLVAYHALSQRPFLEGSGRRLLVIALVLAATSLYPFLYYRTLISLPPGQLILTPSQIMDRYRPISVEKVHHVDIPELFVPRRVTPLSHIDYLGNLFLGLFALSCVQARRKGSLPWIAAFLVFLFISLGPFFVVNQKLLTVGGAPVPTLYSLLLAVCPLALTGTMCHRFLFGAVLCLSLTAAAEFSWSLRRAPRLFRLAAGAVLAGACLVSVALPAILPLPVRLVSLDTSALYRALARDREEYAIVEYPLSTQSSHYVSPPLPQYYSFLQVVHGRKMGNYCSSVPYEKLAQNQFLRHCDLIERAGRTPAEWGDEGVGWFRALNFRYLIVHRSYLTPGGGERLFAFLKKTLGPPVYWDFDDIVVFTFQKTGSGRPLRGI